MSTSKTETQIACALCSLPVKIYSFTLQSPHGEQKFCCAGCLSIYQLFHGEPFNAPNSVASSLKEKS